MSQTLVQKGQLGYPVPPNFHCPDSSSDAIFTVFDKYVVLTRFTFCELINNICTIIVIMCHLPCQKVGVSSFFKCSCPQPIS